MADCFLVTYNYNEHKRQQISLTYALCLYPYLIQSYRVGSNTNRRNGTTIDISELPDTLPAYLINVIPELRIDGEVVVTGSSVNLGANESFTMTFSGANLNSSTTFNQVAAGEFYGIVINPGSISETQLLVLEETIEKTKSDMLSQNYTEYTKDDILGDLFYATALLYYAKYDSINSVESKKMGAVNVRLPSESSVFNKINTTYLFGFPQFAKHGGIAIDVARNISMNNALDGDKDTKRFFNQTSGINSSILEHAVLEDVYSTHEAPVEGISAIKAIQIANDQNIPVYFIDQSNMHLILPQLQADSDVIFDIKNAVNQKKVVIIPQKNITLDGWTGCGYLVLDMEAGDGAYMISGGLNGGQIAVLTILIIF